jgi:hypothetical protein
MATTPNRRRRNMLLTPGNFDESIQKILNNPEVVSGVLGRH